MIGGFFLLDVPTKEDALAWALAAPRRPGPLSRCARPDPASSEDR